MPQLHRSMEVKAIEGRDHRLSKRGSLGLHHFVGNVTCECHPDGIGHKKRFCLGFGRRRDGACIGAGGNPLDRGLRFRKQHKVRRCNIGGQCDDALC